MSWDFKPGAGSASERKLGGSTAAPQLLVVLHSQCPCSVATVENLIDLPPSVRSRLKLHLVFTGPDPQNSIVKTRAEALANVEREYLNEAEVFKTYGARTSGQAFLYDVRGKLVFSGGLTDSRGSEGDSAGMSAIRETVSGRKCTAHAPVYGCAVQTPGSSP